MSEVGIQCPYCFTFATPGTLVCGGPNCGADIIYGSTLKERKQGGGFGLVVGAALPLVVMNMLGFTSNLYVLAAGALFGTVAGTALTSKAFSGKIRFARRRLNI